MSSAPPRLRLFEWSDQRWLSPPFQDALAALLARELGPVYLAAAPMLGRWLIETRTRSIVDLCSGSGGPWATLLPVVAAAGRPLDVLLTDRFAPFKHVVDGARYHPDSVDARAVPPTLSGSRTMFTALHHFSTGEAQRILCDAARRRIPFAAFEMTERRWETVTGMFRVPFQLWHRQLGEPPTRPIGVETAAAPLLYTWDAIVSHLRSFTPDELRTLAAAASASGYRWEVGSIAGPMRCSITYLLGFPENRRVANDSINEERICAPARS